MTQNACERVPAGAQWLGINFVALPLRKSCDLEGAALLASAVYIDHAGSVLRVALFLQIFITCMSACELFVLILVWSQVFPCISKNEFCKRCPGTAIRETPSLDDVLMKRRSGNGFGLSGIGYLLVT